MAAARRGAVVLGVISALTAACRVERDAVDAGPDLPTPPPSGPGAFVRCSNDGWCAAPSLRRAAPAPPLTPDPMKDPPEYWAIASLGSGRFLAAGTRVVTFAEPNEWPPTDITLDDRWIHAVALRSTGRVLLADHVGKLTSAPLGRHEDAWVGPRLAPLRAMFLLDDDEGFLVGDQKSVLHFTGDDLQPMADSPVAAFNGVWGTRDGGIWAVGDHGAIVHIFLPMGDWQEAASPVALDIHAISGSGPDDAWAVGDAGLTLHLHEGTWRVVPSPTNEQLLAVSIVAPTVGFAVGARGTVLSLDGAGKWQVVPCSAGADLRAVAIDAEAHIAWAAGAQGTLVRGWDSFAPMPSVDKPALQPGILLPTPTVTSLILDQDPWQLWVGSAIGVHRVDDQRAFAFEALVPAAGLSAVRGQAFFLAGPAGAFRCPSFLPIVGAFSHAHPPEEAVLSLSPEDAWFAGPDGVRHYQGLHAGLYEIPGSPALHAIAGTSASELFAAGDHGTMVRFDPAHDRWTAVPSGTESNLLGLWAAAPGMVFAVGESGTIAHWDGQGWKGEPSGVQVTLRAVTGVLRSGSWQVFAAGDQGTILRRGPGRWTAEQSGTTRNLHALTAGGPWVFAGGEYYTLLRKEIPGYR